MGTKFFENAAFSSADITWRTPRKFFNDLHNEFNFVMDVCALKNSTLIPSSWYGPDHDNPDRRDCLTQDWVSESGGGYVFMNPPYGRTIKSFMCKASEEHTKGCRVVALVPSRTDTAWWHDYVIPFASDIRFIRGRLKFNDGPNAAPFPSAVVVYGD
jgi:phage N-6-adenine-methyltransferase